MPREPKDPPRIPGYEILEPIGSGGQGAVWRARQKSLDRVVAIKVLWPEDAADPYLSRRFIEEARISSRLNHPNIIQVFDVGETAGTYWYAMEFVAGVTGLQLYRERGPLPEGEVLEIGWQVAQALQHGCDRGLVHGDLKPENIIITPEGVAKVVDFGLARLSRKRGVRPGRDTDPVQGTEGFVAPEILANRSTGDARSDLFSLGVTLYEMLTTSLPAAPRPGSTLGPDPRERRPGTTRRTAEVIMRLLAPDPADRPASPAELLDMMGRRTASNLPPTVTPVAPVKPAHSQRIRPHGSSPRARAIAIAAAAGIVVVAFTWWLLARPKPEPGPLPAPKSQGAVSPEERGDRPSKDPQPSATSRDPAVGVPHPGTTSRDPISGDPHPSAARRDEPPAESQPPTTRRDPASADPHPSVTRREPTVAPPAEPKVDGEPPPPPPTELESRPLRREPVSGDPAPLVTESVDPTTAAAVITALAQNVQVLPPPQDAPGGAWTVIAGAGDACDIAIEVPGAFRGKDVSVDVLNDDRARGLAVKPADAAGTYKGVFRADRSAPFGPREFTIVMKRGGAIDKLRLRIQVVRPSLATSAPPPVLHEALRFLERHQAPDGSIGAAAFPQRCVGEARCDGAGAPTCDPGVTGLAALAALRAGESGPFVRRLVGALVAMQTSDGRFAPADNPHGAYGHMIATEACALAWHLLGDVRARDAAQRGIDAIHAARNVDANGGAWRYAVRGGDNDTSVTIWALRALACAKMAGLKTDPDAFEGGHAWIRRVTDGNQNAPGYGRIGYNAPGMLTVRAQDRALQYPPQLSESLTAGGLHVALATGDRKPTDKVVIAGLALVLTCRPWWDGSSADAKRGIREKLGNPTADVSVISPRDFYYWQHATALFRTWKLARGRPIPEDKRWSLAKVVAPAQIKDGCAKGSFDDPDPWSIEAGRAGSAAMLALALANEHYGGPLVDEFAP